MRRVTGLALILSLAACAKQEPPPAGSSPPAKKSELPVAAVARVDQAPQAGASPAAAAPKAPPVLTTATLTTAPAAATSNDSPIAASAKPAPTGDAKTPDGSALFSQTCATCHMADGGGVPYMQPSIKGSAWISNPDPQPLLSLILRGAAVLGEAANAYDNKMAPQDALSDTEVAAVATYVRQRFAATPITVPVTPAQVAIARSRPGLP